MSMNPDDLRRLIRDTLEGVGWKTPQRVIELLMLTAAQESHCGKYLYQINGPARGIFQMEPATEKDIWDNYLRFRPPLALAVGRERHSMALAGNLCYQILMARVHYMRDSKPIPNADDHFGLARYYKRVWNTSKGKATVEDAVSTYRQYAL